MVPTHKFLYHPLPILFLSLILGLLAAASAATAADDQFIYTAGFTGANLTVDGDATVTASGLIQLTNGTTHQKGHAFHPSPLHLHGSSPNGTVQSFSVAFVFGIVSSYLDFSTHGLALVFAPSKNLSSALTDQYMGLTNAQDNGNKTNHMFAVELDTVQNLEFHDINANHVGIDIYTLSSFQSNATGYYHDSNGSFQNLSLISGEAMQVWVEYDGEATQINVTIAPLGIVKPKKPLLSCVYDLSTVLAEPSYIGFSSATGPGNSRHYVLGWSFGINRPAPVIDIAKLPKLPKLDSNKPRSKVLEITLPIASAALVLAVGIALILLVRRRLRYTELREDWESEFGPHRFAYKDLFHATKGFKDKHLLGAGGFGMVYRGQLQKSGVEVAVKKVSHGSKQGMKEFIAEIVSIGRIRHRNLVQLLGYCRRKDELILVYDYMPNGSLDKYLYSEGDDDPTLDWGQRFRIIKGVASGLHFLHERWEKVVVHRDIKSSNVLLDKEMNGRLGDFGLAKLYEHGANPQTTRVVGTTGYLAPELVRTGKATPFTDVFAFGTFMLEVTCGQRPIKQDEQGNQFLLVDWVLQHWHDETLLEAVDPKLKGEYNSDEVRFVLQIGLLCAHPSATARPSMQQVLQYLDGELPLPEMTRSDLSFNMLALLQKKGLHVMSCPCSSTMVSAGTISDLSGGR
ncbi:unnamed protein product [Urochloa decumbens]|uniref:non-specific serine/threonine protein kinase n=1 Tax=Urochloa decumbens TaxID=240449 RepID=A0ABC9FM46_9POAL